MTHRTFNPAQRPASTRGSAHITGTGTRSRSLTKLRTIDETAELFNTSTRTVRRLIDSGALPAHRLGRCVRISDLDIAVFLAANRSV
jgi:excisionase family DNA binding protein